ncbi:MAG TPA: 50S ribosomal protein L29 [Thermoanaerobaculia bacterium]|jgi:large subunit ribosomal protein L29|nr:50S ribosomal protein L29 [Thermoanaerobaculia bacterium]
MATDNKKKMVTELRNQSAEELKDRERDLSEQLFALRLQKVTGQLEKPARVRQVRRDLARVLTLQREKRG